MGSESSSHDSQYPPFVAFIYVFNLMVGTGCLALPSMLLKGGWVLGVSFIGIVASLSYVSVTFVLESMATANAYLQLKKEGLDESLLSEEAGTRGDDNPKQSAGADEGIFQISKKIEFGEMAGMFFNQWGIIVFYCALILYLIYSTLVARSLAEFFVDLTPASWAFDMYLGIFFFFSLPLCYFDFQKTKLLQMTTLAIRNISLYMTLPNLFGGAVYSFMCHHSLPGIVTPMRNEAHLQRIAGMAYGFVVVVYLASLVSCGFAFEYGFIGNFLFLFPVFTLTSTFPMLSITLCNNIETLILYITNKGSDSPPPPQNSSFRQLMLTLVAVVPPTLLSFISHLVGFTGAFAGCAVMLIIPAALVYCSRKVFDRAWDATKGSSTSKPANFHHSPIAGQGWVLAILAWAGVSLIFNTYEKIFSKLPSA